MSKVTTYCDNCGIELDEITGTHAWTSVPVDIDSANKGESAVLCYACDGVVRQDAGLEEPLPPSLMRHFQFGRSVPTVAQDPRFGDNDEPRR